MPAARRWTPKLLGLLAFVAYAVLAPPGPYWLDSGELGAAGVRMGIAHPTGFPLVGLLQRAAAWLPIGELAFRLHLVSALCAALAVGLAARLVMEAQREQDGAGLAGGILAGALLAASATFFRAATVAEVYAPSAAALLGALVLARRVAAGGGAPAGLALALLAGLAAAGLHPSLRPYLVLPALALCFARLRRGARWPLAAPALLVLGAGALLCALPLRSASGRVAALDWGHPSTLVALWDHAVSAARIRAAYGPEMGSLAREVVLWNGRTFAGLVEADLGLLALLAAAGGLAALLSRRSGRVAGLLLGLIAIADFVWGVWVNPMGLAERQNGVALAACVAVLAGTGVAALGRRFGPGGPLSAAALGFMVALPAWLSATAEKRATRADAARAWAEAQLDRCPPRAVAIVTSDSTAAGLYWLGQVEGARPDVAVLVAQHLWDERRVRAVLGVTGASLDGPTCWEPGPLAPPLPEKAHLSPRELGAIFRPPADDDPNARRLHAVALDALGRALVRERRREPALAAFRAAAEIDPQSAQPWVNLGVVASQAGDLALAARLTERALALNPLHASAAVNAARYHLALGDDAAARRHVERVVRIAPRRADGWALLGTLEARAGRTSEARRLFERALALDPADADARANLARLP